MNTNYLLPPTFLYKQKTGDCAPVFRISTSFIMLLRAFLHCNSFLIEDETLVTGFKSALGFAFYNIFYDG